MRAPFDVINYAFIYSNIWPDFDDDKSAKSKLDAQIFGIVLIRVFAFICAAFEIASQLHSDANCRIAIDACAHATNVPSIRVDSETERETTASASYNNISSTLCIAIVLLAPSLRVRT